MSTLNAFISMWIIPKGSLCEAQRWGLPVPLTPEGLEAYEEKSPDIEQAAALVDASLNARDRTPMREVDLDVASQFHATRMPATLHLEDDSGANDLETEVGRSSRGEYLLHWSCEGLEDLLTNSRTYLQLGPRQVSLTSVRLQTYGEGDHYMVATGEDKRRG